MISGIFPTKLNSEGLHPLRSSSAVEMFPDLMTQRQRHPHFLSSAGQFVSKVMEVDLV
jgi:hypothetical protein